MTVAKIFPVGTSPVDAVRIICEDAEDIVKGAIIGMFGTLFIAPSCGVNISTVVDVSVDGFTLMDGYMVSITPTVCDAEQSYDLVCKKAIIQRFIGLNNEGRAVKFLPIGNQYQFENISTMLN